jgi:Transposase
LYARAAQRGPHAQQVADRFHLLVNLQEAVEHELSRPRRLLFYVDPSRSELTPDTRLSNRSLAMRFRGILRSAPTKGLTKWLAEAKNCGIYSFKRFAETLRRDWAAVQNALKESFSNGPVEGHINRLKTLKRQMYGRAGFELLPRSSAPLCCSLAHSSCTKPESEPDIGKLTWAAVIAGAFVTAASFSVSHGRLSETLSALCTPTGAVKEMNDERCQTYSNVCY